MFSDIASMNVCWYWAIEERRAWRHARRENRKKVGDVVYPSDEMCPTREKPLPSGMKWEDVRKVAGRS
jgi:hypothetical protein